MAPGLPDAKLNASVEALKDLEEFESCVDDKVKSLPIWTMPLDEVLHFLFAAIDHLAATGKMEEASALVSRLSYLAPLLKMCPVPSDNGQNRRGAISERDIERGMASAVAYGHLCEIMPEVRRGYYSVSSSKKEFRLDHADQMVRDSGISDFCLIEINKAAEATKSTIDYERPREILKVRRPITHPLFQDALGDQYRHFWDAIVDPPLLLSNTYSSAFGFSKEEFRKVQAALLAFANLSRSIAGAAANAARAAPCATLRNKYIQQVNDWISPCLKMIQIVKCLENCTGLSEAKVGMVLEPFILDLWAEDSELAGDGYFPPLVCISDTLMFSALAVRTMVHERNLLFSLNRKDAKAFNELVSHSLEPKLLDETAAILALIPGILIEQNVLWERGEVDLLAYDPSCNVVLQLQAKAAIPAQGARMAQQLDHHTKKAIEQLDRLLQTDPAYRDHFCTKVFKRKISGARWISAIMSRSGLGTHRAWSNLNDVIPLNSALLRGSVRHMGSDCALSSLPLVAKDNLDCLRGRLVVGYNQAQISLFGKKISLPTIESNEEEIVSARAAYS